MRRITALCILLSFIILISGCNNTQETTKQQENDVPTASQSANTPTTEEINAKLKSDAVPALQSELSGKTVENAGKKVSASGTVVFIDYFKALDTLSSFKLQCDEDGQTVDYFIGNLLNTTVNIGDTVTIYGSVEKDESLTGLVKIYASIIEIDGHNPDVSPQSPSQAELLLILDKIIPFSYKGTSYQVSADQVNGSTDYAVQIQLDSPVLENPDNTKEAVQEIVPLLTKVPGIYSVEFIFASDSKILDSVKSGHEGWLESVAN